MQKTMRAYLNLKEKLNQKHVACLGVSETNLLICLPAIAQRPMEITKEEKIAALEAEITALNARKMTTTAA